MVINLQLHPNYRALILSILTLALPTGSAYAVACPTEGGRSVGLFVDTSSAIDAVGERILRDGAAAIFDSLSPGDRLTVYSIADQLVRSERLFDGCIPGCADKGIRSDCDVTGGKIRRKRMRNREFAGVINRVVRDTESLPRSEIANTIVRTVLSNKPVDYVYAWTDGFENSSMCRFRDNRGKSCAYQGPVAGPNETPVLKGTVVTLFGVGRSDSVNRAPLTATQLRDLEQFWKRILTLAGADEIRLTIQIGSADVVSKR